ncbi:MAG: hypothetical protein WB952_12025 [Terriglobales bacterium]
MSQVRIDHIDFQMPTGGYGVLFGENSSVTNTYGVIDHDTMECSGGCELLYMLGATNNSPPAPSQGTVNNMFVEDSSVTWTTLNGSNAGTGCMDGWSSNMRVVWRHNTTTDCLVTTHGVTHGGGPDNVELYNNTLKVDSGSNGGGFADCYRCFHHQGSGMFIAFNNLFTSFSGHNSSALDIAHYRSFASGPSSDGNIAACDSTDGIDGNRSPLGSNYGYPCWRQPGRDTTGAYKPIYTWNNYWSDTLAEVPLNLDDFGGVVPDGSVPPTNCNTSASGNCDYFSFQMKANRESYDAISAKAQSSQTLPFNGTTGMGFGTLANRPATCKTNPTESGAGVGYFATDQGSQGVLYTCSATNTWTVYYTPYTYPHPLTTGDSQLPSPPTGLQAAIE